jgi:ferrous iron transport protein B
VLLISLFVPETFQSLALLWLYLIAIIFSIISLKIVSTILHYKPCIKTRLLTYQIPSIKQIFVKILEVLKEFIFKIWIFVIPITIWLTLLFKLPNWDIQTSYWKQIWEKIAVIFQPLWFTEKMSISLISGLIWKELIVSTLSNLYAIENPHNTSLIKEHLQKDPSINFKNTISFLIFVLLYTTCIGSIITASRQLGWKFGLLFAITPFVIAYLISLIIYQALILF